MSGPVSFFDQHVAVADAAGFDLDAHLAAGGFGDGALDDFEISSGFADLDGFHIFHPQREIGDGFSEQGV